MFPCLKITKNKIKIFLFFIFIYFISSILFVFLTAVITKIGGLEIREEMSAISHFLEAIRLLVVSYVVLVFLKKEFFLKKYFKELAGLFFALLIFSNLFALLSDLFYKIGLFKIDSSIIIQAPYFALQLFVYYIIICFIAKED